ncbi:unnamed protein product [Boreogadus saida]
MKHLSDSFPTPLNCFPTPMNRIHAPLNHIQPPSTNHCSPEASPTPLQHAPPCSPRGLCGRPRGDGTDRGKEECHSAVSTAQAVSPPADLLLLMLLTPRNTASWAVNLPAVKEARSRKEQSGNLIGGGKNNPNISASMSTGRHGPEPGRDAIFEGYTMFPDNLVFSGLNVHTGNQRTAQTIYMTAENEGSIMHSQARPLPSDLHWPLRTSSPDHMPFIPNLNTRKGYTCEGPQMETLNAS